MTHTYHQLLASYAQAPLLIMISFFLGNFLDKCVGTSRIGSYADNEVFLGRGLKKSLRSY